MYVMICIPFLLSIVKNNASVESLFQLLFWRIVSELEFMASARVKQKEIGMMSITLSTS